jgi:site-specific DNA-cytosine methylase
MITYADLFTGIGGASIGAKQAGLTPIWGIEKDPAIAHFANVNVGNVTCADVTEVDWSEFQSPDWLHASPPCVNASRQKPGAQETILDAQLSYAIQEAIRVLKPTYFSLENVVNYRNFESFQAIVDCLQDNGFASMRIANVDAADAGVPQNRRRLFLDAVRDLTSFPNPIKQEKVCWFKAIQDFVFDLPVTTITNWQRQALTEEYGVGELPPALVIKRSGANRKNGIPNNTIREEGSPMFTVKAMSGIQRPSVKQATIILEGIPLEADTRCLLRWQSFPDDTKLSGNLVLDTKMIGNAVPPKLMQTIVQSIVPQYCHA